MSIGAHIAAYEAGRRDARAGRPRPKAPRGDGGGIRDAYVTGLADEAARMASGGTLPQLVLTLADRPVLPRRPLLPLRRRRRRRERPHPQSELFG